MTIAELPVTDQKTGFSTMCRRGDHAQCATARARCTCECHTSARTFIKNQKAATRAENRAPTEPAPKPRVTRPKAGEPVFQLVKADPPEPARKKTIAELVRPLLEEIMVTGEHCWYRVVLFPSANQASFNVARLRKAYSPTEWEFRGAHVDEVGQSAIYARWLGTGNVL